MKKKSNLKKLARIIQKKIDKYPLLEMMWQRRIKIIRIRKNGEEGGLEYEGLTPIEVLIKNKKYPNIYFFLNESKAPDKCSTKKKDITGKPFVICIDYDPRDKNQPYKGKADFLKKLRKFPLPPTMIVDSGYGIHVYWQLKKFPLSQFEDYMNRLILHFKTDDSIWPLYQVMRLPLTFNCKKGWDKRRKTKILEYSPDNIYTKKQLDKVLPDLPEEPKTFHGKSGRPRKLDTFNGQIIPNHIPRVVKQLMVLKPWVHDLFFKKHRMTEAIRSSNKKISPEQRADYKLANALIDNAVPEEYIVQTLYQRPHIKELSARNRQDYVFRTVQKALYKNKNRDFAKHFGSLPSPSGGDNPV